MAQISFEDFRTKVREWANRDATALPDLVINDTLFFAHDEANRRLKIPTLEQRQHYYIYTYEEDGTVDTVIPSAVLGLYPNIIGVAINTISNTIAFSGQELQLPIPVDTTTFISLRVSSSDNSNHAGVVFNEKLDIRTYFDQEAYVRNANIWTRQGDLMHVIGLYGPADIIELFYYKRLPDPDARYDVTQSNFTSKLLTYTATATEESGPLEFVTGTTVSNITTYLTDTTGNVDAPLFENTAGNGESFDFLGNEVFNWLRDENQRVLLFGALYQCFDYLGDAEMKGTYAAKFASSIEELNEEEKKRVASGGNVQVNYSSYLLSGGAFF